MMRPVVALVSVAAVVLATTAVSAAGNVVVRQAGVEPPVLHTTTGTRVQFENHTGRAVHLEFEGDSRLHEVVQAPATGPFWVIFNHPGTHRYVVHVYETRERTLPGVVEVTEGTGASTAPPGCGVAVLGICVER